MYLYQLEYEEFRQHDYTTSDGFDGTEILQSRVREMFKAKSDDTAKATAQKMIRKAKRGFRVVRIEVPILASVVPLPKVKGVQSWQDIYPSGRFTKFICK